ncbi:shikimate kinase [Uliginosibacterium gangwonense]|uniref:shikimate kinase n=1 Tax=Uliginosibacterium gangwonense TaxID=392736 RepID=UPI000527F954|nr:shikimate kinase [Uliginosibacterium gangwonense]
MNSLPQTLRVLVIGASGSGTSTLGRAMAAHLGCPFYDLDDFYWLCSTPAFTSKRPHLERLCMALAALHSNRCCIMAGSPDTWGDALENGYTHIIFLSLDAKIRVERLAQRETQGFGYADPAFLDWAAQYDEGRLRGRSRAIHERWLAARQCPVLRLEGDQSTEERRNSALDFLQHTSTTAQSC